MRAGRHGAVALLLLAACSVAGCGATSDAKRTALIAALNVQFQAAGVSSALTGCISQRAEELPLGQLQRLAGSGAGSSAASSLIGRQFRSCFTGPAGVAQMRSELSKDLPATAPTAIRSCYEAKIAAVSSNELANLWSDLMASGGSTTTTGGGRVEAEVNALADQCLELPAARPVLVRNLLLGLQQSSSANGWSAAFKACFARKWRARLEKLPSAELVRLVTQPGASDTPAAAAGKAAGRSCEASGISP
jgi:hypothetical protein